GNRLPTIFRLTGGTGGAAKSVLIKRYNRTVTGVDFTSLWDCINVCSDFASKSNGLEFGPELVEWASLDLNSAIQCRKIEEIVSMRALAAATEKERTTGREICRSPNYYVTSVRDIAVLLGDLVSPDQPYRTLSVAITDGFESDELFPFPSSAPSQTSSQQSAYPSLAPSDEPSSTPTLTDEPSNTPSSLPSSQPTAIIEIAIQTNRGLSLALDPKFQPDEDPSIGFTMFRVNFLAELYFEELKLNNGTEIQVDYEGFLDISGCELSSADPMRPFLVNSGLVEMASVKVVGDTILQNIATGSMDLMYVDFYDSSALENNDEAVLELSRLSVYDGFDAPSQANLGGGRVILKEATRRLSLHDGFDVPSQANLGGGRVILKEATRRYNTLDKEENKLCNGTDLPDKTLELGAQKCKEQCEAEFVCSGAFTYFDKDNIAHCDLCLNDTDCAFNCSGPTTAYYKPRSNFYYTRVDACITPAQVGELEVLEGASLEECKLYCEWFRSYLDLNDSCDTQEAKNTTMFLPYYSKRPEDYLEVKGIILESTTSMIVAYSGKNVSECGQLCDKTLGCRSFYAFDEDSNDCQLYRSDVFERVGYQTGLYISTDNLFPKKRYMMYNVCPFQSAFNGTNTKTKQRCKLRCDADQNCLAYTYMQFQSLDDNNCKLHNRFAVIDELFEDNTAGNCEETEVNVAYTTESFVENDVDGLVFNEIALVENILEDECKSLCLFDSECVSLQYKTFSARTNSSLCSIGNLSEPPLAVIEPTSQPSEGPSMSPSESPSMNPSGSSYPTFTTAPSAETLILNVSNSIETTYVLEASTPDLGSEYLTATSCYDGEPLHVTSPRSIELANGYVRWERACTSATPIGNADLDGRDLVSPSECGLACDKVDECGGFIYYVNNTGQLNVDLIGQCKLIGGSIWVGECDDTVENQAGFNSVNCNLFSDIALRSCKSDEKPIHIHLGLTYRERDALVEATGQCFVEFEDTAEIGCYSNISEAKSFQLQSVKNAEDGITAHHCQQHCKDAMKPFYAVAEGTECYCSDSNAFVANFEEKESNCTTPCSGDDRQTCGGNGFALLGETDLPIYGLTLSQWKCFEDKKCEAIYYFNDNGDGDTECELRPSAVFETCNDSDKSKGRMAFIQSLEISFTQKQPSLRLIVLNYVMHIGGCESVLYEESLPYDNCLLRGGDIVRLGENQTAEGVSVARDVTMFTKGFQPKGDHLFTISGVFDLDECKALCEAHVDCGGLTFGLKSCTMFAMSGFVDVEASIPAERPHYVGFNAFPDVEQQFTRVDGFCIDGGEEIFRRKTIQSAHDCARQCNSRFECKVFTYHEGQPCVLYNEKFELKDSCAGVSTSVYIMYTPGSFTLREDACLKEEAQDDKKEVLEHKNVVECAAFCEAWWNCRSFRSDSNSLECILYEQERFGTDLCEGDKPAGDLYVYYSESFFVRLTESFCVASNTIIGSLLSDMPLEACKTICDKNPLCLALEHDENGNCALYKSSDFSIPCISSEKRVLYINYRDVIELGRNKFTYKQKQDLCDGEPQCLGYQYNYTGDGHNQCFIVTADLPEDMKSCSENESFSFRVERYPYQKLKNTCLQNEIYDTGEEEFRLYDMEEYECLSLCDNHPFCRYFLYGTSKDNPNLELRETALQSVIRSGMSARPSSTPGTIASPQAMHSLTRVISANFSPDDDVALYLSWFARLFMGIADVAKFSEFEDYCVSAENYSFSVEGFLRDVLFGQFALAYSIPNLSASPSAVGCLGMEEIEYVSDDEFSYYEITGGENAGFKVPLEETCDENQVTVETCKKLQ
ncbi:hypothetical protein THAOC_05646, partial [Thalassiosira oceanica]